MNGRPGFWSRQTDPEAYGPRRVAFDLLFAVTGRPGPTVDDSAD